MAFEWWMVTFGANVVMVASYSVIAYTIIEGIVRGRQWTSNPIAMATAAIFVTCTVGHGGHLVHAAGVWTGESAEAVAAMRAVFSDPRLWVWDGITAVVAIWYLTLRNRLPVVVGGAALCADMESRQRDALVLHQGVVSGLERAKASLDAGRREDGAQALGEALESAKGIITKLIGEHGTVAGFSPGDLRRKVGGR